jgi:hypothetical protein
MANSLDPSSSPQIGGESTRPGEWVKVGAVAAASALAGGLVATWWYRKTLARLREADESGHNPHFGIPEGDPADEA